MERGNAKDLGFNIMQAHIMNIMIIREGKGDDFFYIQRVGT